MVKRISALAEQYVSGHFGKPGESGVRLQEMGGLILHQIAAWPDSIAEVGALAARTIGLDGEAAAKQAPGPCRALSGTAGSLLRVEPLKWWLVDVAAPPIDPQQGATLDLSHSRTHLRVNGPAAVAFLNRHLPLDLREHAFPVGALGSSALHHLGVTLWRSNHGYELFIPRGFALSLWQVLTDSAKQFGLQVV